MNAIFMYVLGKSFMQCILWFRVIFKQEYKKPETKQLPIVIKAEFPKNNDKNDVLIDFIAVDDFNGSETVHQDKVCITKGGIGQKYVEIVIETRRRWGIRGYNVAMYGKWSFNF